MFIHTSHVFPLCWTKMSYDSSATDISFSSTVRFIKLFRPFFDSVELSAEVFDKIVCEWSSMNDRVFEISELIHGTFSHRFSVAGMRVLGFIMIFLDAVSKMILHLGIELFCPIETSFWKSFEWLLFSEILQILYTEIERSYQHFCSFFCIVSERRVKLVFEFLLLYVFRHKSDLCIYCALTSSTNQFLGQFFLDFHRFCFSL